MRHRNLQRRNHCNRCFCLAGREVGTSPAATAAFRPFSRWLHTTPLNGAMPFSRFCLRTHSCNVHSSRNFSAFLKAALPIVLGGCVHHFCFSVSAVMKNQFSKLACCTALSFLCSSALCVKNDSANSRPPCGKHMITRATRIMGCFTLVRSVLARFFLAFISFLTSASLPFKMSKEPCNLITSVSQRLGGIAWVCNSTFEH
jgi:hypothetical protein